MYRISEYLTPSERMEAIRFGAMRKLASMGMSPSDFGREMEKAADGVPNLSMLGTALRTAVMIGAPIGAVMYVLKSSMKGDTTKTKKLKATLDHYNDVSFDAKNRLQMMEGEGDRGF